MKIRLLHLRLATVATTLALCAAILPSCGDILAVTDPDVVVPESLTGAQGADLFYGGGIADFAQAFSANWRGLAVFVGLFTDEFYKTGTAPATFEFDRRSVGPRNVVLVQIFRNQNLARQSTLTAARKLSEIDPTDPRIGEMLALNGFTHLFIAENFCSGAPLSDMDESGEPQAGPQLTTEEWFDAASDRFREAAQAPSLQHVQNLAAVGRARSLVNLGLFQEAAQAIEDVPTSWQYLVRMSSNSERQSNSHELYTTSRRTWSVSSGEGINGLGFRDQDPRVPWVESDDPFDQTEPVQYRQTKFPDRDSPIVLASGIEARLIEAEAALQNEAVDTWLTKLNEARATLEMEPLEDPGTEAARVDLLFAERARWFFGDGHRLGDLRRLVRQYGRDAESVFPTGEYRKGGAYGTDLNWVIPDLEINNPNFTGCFDRDA